MDAAPSGRKLKCPCCGTPANTRCPNPDCRATIVRRGGHVEEARIGGQLAYSRRSNNARANEYAGPQRAVHHNNRLHYHDTAPLDSYIVGGEAPGAAVTKGAAA